MRRRQAFTIVELLVALALIIFIMVILTEAFSAGMQAFRHLKAIGDMNERLRATASVLRRDLSADHFTGRRRISDVNFWNDGPPPEGFFAIYQGGASQPEGDDPDFSAVLPNYWPVRATNHTLHFAVKLRGNQRSDFFSARLPLQPGPPPTPSPVITATTNFFNQPGDGRYQEDNQTYNSQWAEVVYVMLPNGTTAGGTPLYALYRCQFVVVPDNSNLNGNVAPGQLGYHYEMSCQPDPNIMGNPLHFNTPSDLTNSVTRAYSAPSNYANTGRGAYDTNNANFPSCWAATLLMTDVLSFDVRILQQQPGNPPDAIFTDVPNGNFDTGSAPPPPYTIRAIQITIRVWDLKTEQARQVTLIQDM